MVYQAFAGDQQITTRVLSESNTHTFAKAGVMFRNGLSANAAHIILDINPGGNIEFMQRSANVSSTTYIGGTNP